MTTTRKTNHVNPLTYIKSSSNSMIMPYVNVTGSSIVIFYVLSKTRTLVVWIKYSIFITSQGSERYNY